MIVLLEEKRKDLKKQVSEFNGEITVLVIKYQDNISYHLTVSTKQAYLYPNRNSMQKRGRGVLLGFLRSKKHVEDAANKN